MKGLWISVLLGAQVLAAPASATSPIHIGFPEGLPGYELQPNGELHVSVPFKRAITDCVRKGLGAKVIWQGYPTKRVVQMLIDNELDLIFPMGFTEERAATMLQSDYVWENWDYFLSLRPINPNEKGLKFSARHGSPQHLDYVANGYTNVSPSYTYEDLVRVLKEGLVDVVIVPQSVYEEQKADFPANTLVTKGRQRNTGFYLNKVDPKQLYKTLNRRIAYCRSNFAPK
jgi:hypothetical protein